MAKPNVSKDGIPEGADPEIIAEMRAAGELDEDENLGGEDADGGEGGEADDEGKPGKGKPAAKPKAGDDDEPKPGEGDDDLPNDRVIDREPKHIPVWKAKEMAKEAAAKARQEGKEEAESTFATRIKEANQKPNDEKRDTELEEIAEEFGMDISKVSKFADRVAAHVQKGIKLPQLPEGLEEQMNTIRDQAKSVAEEKGFQQELSDAATRKAIQAASGGSEVTQEVVEKIKELAYSTTYAKYRLSDIIALNAGSLFPKGKKGVEGGKGGSKSSSGIIDFENVTDEDIENMSDEEFDKYSDALAKKSSSFTSTKKR